ncbi:MAG: alginate lyase family protein [Gemmatimonadaceae bacterium]|nr:alginate lyase family protein [Chitinophagaceae bacterium]
MIKTISLTICLLTFVSFSQSQQPSALLLNETYLSALKEKVKKKDPAVIALVENLEQQAQKLVDMKPVSVMDKTILPPSGNKHDYMSQAPYFWYDSSKPNGLPYLRRDGQRNPEINKITDRSNLGKLDESTRILSLAYFLTGKEAYAAKSAGLLKAWFINEDTKMNPHLEYGQGIPGINTGRGIGIIETVALTGIADAVLLLKGSPSWKSADDKAVKNWYAKYLDWLLTSKYGIDEHNTKNNHATWYYAQTIDFALFTGDKEKAITLVNESKKRLDSQINKEGKMQLELDRTNGLGYSSMNIQGWFRVATLANLVGIDLWNYKTPEGVGIKTALDWLLPYATGEKKWEYEQISPYNKTALYSLLLQAKNIWKDPQYPTLIAQLRRETADKIAELQYGN